MGLDNPHTSILLDIVGKEFDDGKLVPKTKSSNPDATQSSKPIYKIFASGSADYTTPSIGHSIGSDILLQLFNPIPYTYINPPIHPLLKQKYKRTLKVHDTLDMIQDAFKLRLVSYAETLGHGIGYIGRKSSTLDIGKGFVGGLGAGNEIPGWVGLSGDRK